MEVATLKAAAAGRWKEVLSHVGINESLLDGAHHPCPKCGGTDRFRMLNEQCGALICNQCFTEKNGDGLAAVRWMTGKSFPETIETVSEILGVNGSNKQTPQLDIVERIAREKRIPIESFREFGAAAAQRAGKHGDFEVCRVPMFGPDLKPCSSFDMWPSSGPQTSKGLNERGKQPGLFVRRDWKPTAGETVHLVEGVKDAAALQSIGFPAIGLPHSQLSAKFAHLFREMNVVIIPDRDQAGQKGANKTASILAGIVSSVSIAHLPAPLQESGGDGIREILHQAEGADKINTAIQNAIEWQPEAVSSPETPEGDSDAKPTTQAETISEPETKQRIRVTNAAKEKDDEGHEISVPLTMENIIFQIDQVTGNSINRVGSALFIHEGDSIDWLSKPAAMTGYIGTKAGLPTNFVKTPGYHSPTEVFAEFQRTATKYDDVECFPHFPKVPGVYYTCADPKPGDGKTLNRLLDRFNPETDIDRDLLMAMFVTPGWGSAGNRPAFGLSSDDGRGVGKTSTAKSVGRVWGGRIEMTADEAIEVVKQRLLTPSARTIRVANLDNLKSRRWSNAGIEALITSDIISGKQMYYGEGQRPNNLTWIITLNGPSFATDLAQRTVVIKLKRPEYSGNWQDETEAFIDDNREAIIADCIEFLKRPADYELAKYTRWGNWERDILSRLPDPGEAQQVIMERQKLSDAEGEESSDFEDAIREKLREARYNPDTDVVFIPSKMAAEWLSEVTGERYGTNKASRDIMQRIAEGRVSSLSRNTCNSYGRGFVWSGKDSHPDDQISTDLETRLTEQKGY